MILLERGSLENGLQLAFYDTSRVLAGDRWLVELEGRAIYSLVDGWPLEPEETDRELRQAIVDRLGTELQFTLRRNRHFVDQRDREEVLRQLLAALKEHMVAYLAAPVFPARLFADTWRRLKEECALEIKRRRLAAPDLAEDDDGPDDFSAIFRPRP